LDHKKQKEKITKLLTAHDSKSSRLAKKHMGGIIGKEK
jgi:hypothetical protein